MNVGEKLSKVEKFVTEDHVNRYADVSGDRNPIHVDTEFAATSRFGRKIAHGMMVASTISEMMTQTFGQQWHQSGSMKLRFKAPVFPGDQIVASGIVESIKKVNAITEVVCSVQVTKINGEKTIIGEVKVEIGQSISES